MCVRTQIIFGAALRASFGEANPAASRFVIHNSYDNSPFEATKKIGKLEIFVTAATTL